MTFTPQPQLQTQVVQHGYMADDLERRRRVGAELVRLTGGDPFSLVAAAAEEHRAHHLQGCGLYSAGPSVMRLAATFARAGGARRVLDLGTGFGYSALWLADAIGPTGHVTAIDRHDEHIGEARRFAAQFGLDDRTTFVVAEVDDALRDLDQPFDLVHDDAWFAQEPSYLDAMLGALRPGGMVTMPNWFLLEDAVTGEPRNEWAAFAGPEWAAATRRYAARLLADDALHVTFVVSPPLGVVVKL